MKKSALIFALALLGLISKAQHTNIIISEAQGICEPSIIINPKNTNHVVAGTILDLYFFSKDGGLTWDGGKLTSPWGVWGDPCVVVDTAGRYYFFHLSNPPVGNWIDRIVCQSKDSISAEWDRKSYMGLNGTKAQDKEWAAVCPFTNNIYISWTQFDSYGSTNPSCESIIRFSRSTDQGLTWMEPIRLNNVPGNCIDDGHTVEGAVPAVGPNGEVYIAWAGVDGLRFNRSLDQGLTWLENDILINQEGGNWNQPNIPGISRCNGMPVTTCDISGGPHNGTIYVNWTDQRNGEDDTDVWLSKSTDGGNTWSEPVRVNDDPPGRHQFFTWMAIDQTNGYLYFVFYDRRNHNDAKTDVYLACSRDGGQTFINTLISETPFIPNKNIFFGDYTNISAHDNVIRPIWTRMHNNTRSVLTAIIDPLALQTPQTQAELWDEMELYPNPFSHTAYITFRMTRPGNATLKVFDVTGALVSIIYDNQWLEAGRYVEHFDAHTKKLPQGVYFFRLITPGSQRTQKIVFQK